MNEQTSIYDVERQPLMDLEKPLIKGMAVTLTGLPRFLSMGAEVLNNPFKGKGFHGGAVMDMSTPITMTFTETHPNPTPLHALCNEWANLSKEVSAPANVLVIDQSVTLDHAPFIRSRHMRWTTEHATDVMLATHPVMIGHI